MINFVILILLKFDPHSAFEYNGGILTTGLHERLQEKRISVLFLAGLALEYGVFYTAQDAAKRSRYHPLKVKPSYLSLILMSWNRVLTVI